MQIGMRIVWLPPVSHVEWNHPLTGRYRVGGAAILDSWQCDYLFHLMLFICSMDLAAKRSHKTVIQVPHLRMTFQL